MCGIVAVLQTAEAIRAPSPEEVRSHLREVDEAHRAVVDDRDIASAGRLEAALDDLAADLAGPLAAHFLTRDDTGREVAAQVLAAVEGVRRSAVDTVLDVDPDHIEVANQYVIRILDVLWRLADDLVGQAERAAEIAPAGVSAEGMVGYVQIRQALSAIERLEVRGRDSAGLAVIVTGHGLTPSAARDDVASVNRTVRISGDHAVFFFKVAAEIGELGDNTRFLGLEIANDDLLHRALDNPGAATIVVGHTRWASVGAVTEPNCHPVDSVQRGGNGPLLAVSVVNGDFDNHQQVRRDAALEVPESITTDSKLLPVLAAEAAASTDITAGETIARVTEELTGSYASVTWLESAPDELVMAVRGSGQALYAGLTDAGTTIIGSEVYGIVEQARRYIRLDGRDAFARGMSTEVVTASRDGAGHPSSLRRLLADGRAETLSDDDTHAAEITTRDIDRRGYPHFLLKEIHEAPRSFANTTAGFLVNDGSWKLRLPTGAFPGALRERITRGDITRIILIGQGTAAIAAHGISAFLARVIAESDVHVESMPATEMSGFDMTPDMSDCLVIAVSQSGTTTDTNRTVDLVRDRGATVLAIVNRRGSDLTDRAHAVIYTSNGRDIEMAVPSTKAFYSQVAAGILISCKVAELLGRPVSQALLGDLDALPAKMSEVLDRRSQIFSTVEGAMAGKRHWAIVGNGANYVAARELRIKLSELCYRAIACDYTEDKKHIDLSSEPLIIVCAAGLTGGVLSDVAKEVQIFAAHRAHPVVIATDGAELQGAEATIEVPTTHPDLAFILSTMAGHLLGYELALAIDRLADPLRAIRSVLEIRTETGAMPADKILQMIKSEVGEIARQCLTDLRRGRFDADLGISDGLALARALEGLLVDPLRAQDPPVARLEALADALGTAVDELTRPVDTIKHQAKTVTVGVSRDDEELLASTLVREVQKVGADGSALAYTTLRSLNALSLAVVRVDGSIRYEIEDPSSEKHLLSITARTGISETLPSRVEHDRTLRGTKSLVARRQQVWAGRGRNDQRMLVVVPEVTGGVTTAVTVLHVELHERLGLDDTIALLDGYYDRHQALKELVEEQGMGINYEAIQRLTVDDLLLLPLSDLADQVTT